MKRLILFLLLASIASAKEYPLLPPHIPAPKIIEAIPPPQTHVFAALDVNNAFTGNNTHSGTETFTGLLNCKNFENIQCVDSVNNQGWAGADIGAWINAAYAALPASGGTIYISGGTLSSPASFTTPVVESTLNKPALNQCLSGAVLKFTPNSGTAFTFGWLGTGEDWNGMRDCTLLGSGSTQTAKGISINSRGVTIEGLKVASSSQGTGDGFGTAIEFTANGYLSTILHSMIAQSTTCINWTGATERNTLAFSTLTHCGTALNNAIADISSYSISFDDCLTTCIVGTNATLYSQFGGHFENIDQAGGATENYINASGNAQFYLHGVDFLTDKISGTQTQWILASGTSYIGFGCDNQASSAGETLTQIVTFSGTARGEICQFNSTGNIGAGFNTAYAGAPVLWTPMNTLATTTKVLASNALPILEGNVTAINAGSCTVESNHLHVFCGAASGQTSLSFFQPAVFNWRFGMPAGSSTFTWANTANLATPLFQIDQNGKTSSASSSNAVGFLPLAAGASDLGSTSLPHANLWLGTAATNNFKFQPAATTGTRIITMADPLSPTTVGLPLTIASGTTTLTANAALAAVTSQAANTTAATGVLTTDVITWSFATAPTAGDNLCHVLPYVTAGNVNFVRTNPTAAAQNVSALVINWKVVR